MNVFVAFYKARGTHWDRLIRLVTRSLYSHCELAIPDPNRPGVYFCVTASARDRDPAKKALFAWDKAGVRGKFMRLAADRWDLLPCAVRADDVHAALIEHGGQRYDWLGVLRFVIPLLPQSKNRWFCSEFVANVLHLSPPSRYTPQTVYQYLKELQQ